VECLLDAMRHYRADEKIQVRTALLLAWGESALLYAIAFTQYYFLQHFSCQALLNLSRQAEGADSLVDSEGVFDLLSAMRNLPNHAGILHLSSSHPSVH
jgi:hypothetical protein